MTLPGVVAVPDWHPSLCPDLSDKAELDELVADFGESRSFHRVGRHATVIALRCGAHHHKLRIGKFDAHDPTLPLIQEARRSGPHQDEPRIGQSRWGGWVTRARLLSRPPKAFDWSR